MLVEYLVYEKLATGVLGFSSTKIFIGFVYKNIKYSF